MIQNWSILGLMYTHVTTPMPLMTPCARSPRIATVLPSHQFHVMRIILIDDCVIKHHKSMWRWTHFAFYILPHQVGSDFIPSQISIRHVVAEFFSMLGIIRQRIIDLAHQQVLTIIQSGHAFCFCFHPLTVTHFARSSTFLSCVSPKIQKS